MSGCIAATTVANFEYFTKKLHVAIVLRLKILDD